MALRWEAKRPAEVRTYQIDWSTFLGTDTISSHTIVAVGVTVDNGGGQGVVDTGDQSITLKLSGGTTGTLARITNTIVTAAGETEVENIVLYISDFAEPVSLELAKAQIRELRDFEDSLIWQKVRSAREVVEGFTGHILVRRPIVQTFSGFRSYLELFHRPVVEIVGIDYTDTDGADQEILPAGLIGSGNPYRIRPVDTWPTIQTHSPVTVNYIAGYDEGEVPEKAIEGILVLIAGMVSSREGAYQTSIKALESVCSAMRVPVV